MFVSPFEIGWQGPWKPARHIAHEDPSIPNFGKKGTGAKLKNGMTLAIEPMVNEGDYRVLTAKDGWTVLTSDGSPSAHFEHTILISNNKPEILTVC